MLKLLKKELVLSMHPITPIMLLLSAMVMIPNYPYSVVFFYTTLAIFFTCLLGRENNDIIYSLNLPIAKKDIVKARMSFCMIQQLLQMLIAVPFCILSQKVNVAGNAAGMEPNITYFGIGFVLYGLFNLIFFSAYYAHPNKVGVSFLVSSTVIFILIIVEVILTHAVPFVRDCLDTKDPMYLGTKLGVLLACIVIYCALTGIAYKKAVASFEKQDL